MKDRTCDTLGCWIPTLLEGGVLPFLSFPLLFFNRLYLISSYGEIEGEENMDTRPRFVAGATRRPGLPRTDCLCLLSWRSY